MLFISNIKSSTYGGATPTFYFILHFSFRNFFFTFFRKKNMYVCILFLKCKNCVNEPLVLGYALLHNLKSAPSSLNGIFSNVIVFTSTLSQQRCTIYGLRKFCVFSLKYVSVYVCMCPHHIHTKRNFNALNIRQFAFIFRTTFVYFISPLKC